MCILTRTLWSISALTGTLIEGESLMNDGSAVVLYVWVKNVVGYAVSDVPPWWMEDRLIGIELLRVVAQVLPKPAHTRAQIYRMHRRVPCDHQPLDMDTERCN